MHRMKRVHVLMTGGVLVLAAIGSAAGIAAATGGDDNESPITGTALEKASAAALAHTGEGSVTETEVGDEDGYYEVEVTLGDGSQVDVHLDAGFNVISSQADDDNSGDNDGSGDD
ncbi:MAG: hypothetical protein WEC75_14340 [Dehalococcoidia bacterium]